MAGGEEGKEGICEGDVVMWILVGLVRGEEKGREEEKWNLKLS